MTELERVVGTRVAMWLIEKATTAAAAVMSVDQVKRKKLLIFPHQIQRVFQVEN